MNKKILIVAILIINTISLSAQWEVKNVEEEYETLFVIKFFDSTNGLAMGTNGLILKSTDEGENWEILENEIIGVITDFDYISLDTIIALSTIIDGSLFERIVYKSIDGGLSWEQKYSEEGGFSCIQFIDNQKGVASGSGGILKSNDGGESWETVYDMLLNGFDFGEVRRFEMVNDSIGFAVGTGKESNSNIFRSFFLKTTNGGASWQELNQLDNWFQEIDFINEDLGYVSDFEYTYKTLDGGISWDTLSNLGGVVGFSTPSVNKVITVNRPGAYIPEAPSTVFAISTSQDSGEIWEGEFMNGAHMETVFFHTDSIGFVAGDYSIIMKTENGGGEITGDYPWHLFTTSTNDLKETKLEFYPNPTIDKLFITELDNTIGWNYSIETLNGITLKNGFVNNLEIDVSEIPQGLFILILQKANHRKIGKFMKL